MATSNYVVNRRNTPLTLDVSFRTSVKSVELWDPITGSSRAASYRAQNGRTVVSLTFESMGSVFVVALQDGPPTHVVAPSFYQAVYKLEGQWDVALQLNGGAPPSVTLPFLNSLSEQNDLGVRYFSGTATYTRVLEAPSEWFTGKSEVWLDLGEVRDIANVRLNGQDLGVQWCPPYRYKISEILRPGKDTLSIEVTNIWLNRLVGDQQEGMKQVTFSPMPGVLASTPLLPSGLHRTGDNRPDRPLIMRMDQMKGLRFGFEW